MKRSRLSASFVVKPVFLGINSPTSISLSISKSMSALLEFSNPSLNFIASFSNALYENTDSFSAKTL
uniref:Uncharacterized protein n=1 Tax=Yersinia enterocolitica TaxID=630 RepID=B0RKM4_YEREN|nr:hypothetical protein [Yersinia enterocolitica]